MLATTPVLKIAVRKPKAGKAETRPAGQWGLLVAAAFYPSVL